MPHGIGGAGGALAATQSSTTQSSTTQSSKSSGSQAYISDLAGRLNVTPSALSAVQFAPGAQSLEFLLLNLFLSRHERRPTLLRPLSRHSPVLGSAGTGRASGCASRSLANAARRQTR